jgi:hypothetical protein
MNFPCADPERWPVIDFPTVGEPLVYELTVVTCIFFSSYFTLSPVSSSTMRFFAHSWDVNNPPLAGF